MTLLDAVLGCARASAAAYEVNAAARAALLAPSNLTELAYLEGSRDARALVFSDSERRKCIAFQGTQFSKGELASILANLDEDPVSIGKGRAVMCGYYDQLEAIQLVIDGGWFDIATGHSMGGAVAHLFANFSLHEVGRLVTFGAPRCANAEFWRQANVAPDRFVHEWDFAPVHPFLASARYGYVQPLPQAWLHDGKVTLLTGHRPGLPDSVEDHGIEKYIEALAALSTPTAAPQP